MSDGPSARWEYYLLLREEQLRDFWVEHLRRSRRAVLVILGRGFDPRMGLGLKTLLEAGGDGPRDVLGLDFREGPMSASLNHQELVTRNWAEVEAAVGSRGTLSLQALEFWSPEGRRISSQSARDLFDSDERFSQYTDVVVDISSMPRGVYFPLIARILYLLDHSPSRAASRTNLHVLVAEDPGYDAGIHEEGIDEKAEFMASFGGGFDEEGTPTPKVWMPLLGEGRRTQFDRIQDRVKPDEICPVLPSPSRNPRRSDDIVIEYQQPLFDELHLDGRNFLYASERNPFEVYRRLRGAVLRYGDVFRILGGCRVAISPLSSKLMSIGALLTAYELKQLDYRVGIAHVDSQGYRIEGTTPKAELFGLWLTGECDAN
jgi:hypothetical protein